MDMRKYLGMSIVLLALLLASGIPTLAKDSRHVTLGQDAVLRGTSLPAGEYVVRWTAHSPQAAVEFRQGHTVVLTTEGRIEDRGKKYDADMVLYNVAQDGTNTLREIRFAGSSQVLVFSQ
jgi:hypothetical protein